MNKKEAKQKIDEWFTLPRVKKAKEWDKLVPYINKYRDLYLNKVMQIKKERNIK